MPPADCPNRRQLSKPVHMKDGRFINDEPCRTTSCGFCCLNLAEAAALVASWGRPTAEAVFSADGLSYGAYRKAMNNVALDCDPLCWYAEASSEGTVILAVFRTPSETDDQLEELRSRAERAGRRRRLVLGPLERTNAESVREWFLDWVREGPWLEHEEFEPRLKERTVLNGRQVVHGSRDYWLDPGGAPGTMKSLIRRAERAQRRS